jgi:hypothetical protein
MVQLLADTPNTPETLTPLQGLKYFDLLDTLLRRLHEVGCERDHAHNRQLHYDQYAMLILLFLFNPAVATLRGRFLASVRYFRHRPANRIRISIGCEGAERHAALTASRKALMSRAELRQVPL